MHYEHIPRYLQLPQQHSGPDQVFIKFLKISRFADCLISLGSLFQILGPRLLSVYDPYFLECWLWTISLSTPVSALLVFSIKISFIYGAFILFIVLNISVANSLNRVFLVLACPVSWEAGHSLHHNPLLGNEGFSLVPFLVSLWIQRDRNARQVDNSWNLQV